MANVELLACCAFGLEAVVVRELQKLGYDGKGAQPGWVLFTADEAAICRANLWLRSADRVAIRVGEFPAGDFEQLFEATRDLPWEQWLPPDAAFPVNGRSIKSRLSSVPACQRAVKKAIVDRLRAAYRRHELPETGATFRVELSLLKDVATLSLDTTGASLHKRGYRQMAGAAPLKETLAAAMVQLSFWRPDRPLLDPFCGSGTIPIEAALWAGNRAPGLMRAFAAESWPALPARMWATAREEARGLEVALSELSIEGSDIDAALLQRARQHARQAGVADWIRFQQRDLATLSDAREYGCMIGNPPYGERMGGETAISALYASMSQVFARLPTWSFYMLTSYPDFERVLGRTADRRRKLYNGRLECTYYQFHGPRPPDAPRAMPSSAHLRTDS
jgi:putative N6-adenine-specific DNA methylase